MPGAPPCFSELGKREAGKGMHGKEASSAGERVLVLRGTRFGSGEEIVFKRPFSLRMSPPSDKACGVLVGECSELGMIVYGEDEAEVRAEAEEHIRWLFAEVVPRDDAELASDARRAKAALLRETLAQRGTPRNAD